MIYRVFKGFFNEKLSKNQKYRKYRKFFKWMIFTIFISNLLFKNYQAIKII